jgi:hypothetical protein
MKLFTMYRKNVPTDTHDETQRNAPDEPQFQGVQFDDGRVAVRWLDAVVRLMRGSMNKGS